MLAWLMRWNKYCAGMIIDLWLLEDAGLTSLPPFSLIKFKLN